ncbi:MAG TPA: DUF1254 domain-containing protein [Chryseolinea sp.]
MKPNKIPKNYRLSGKNFLLSVAVASMITLTDAYAQTPSSVETRIGTLTFDKGAPSGETSKKLFDEMDFQRAVQAYLWAYPAVSFESIRLTMKNDIGLDYNDFGIADNLINPKSVWLTANNTTVYALANIDLGKFGPMVIDVPPGAIVGLMDDFWQRSIADIGLPGPYGDKGGKYLLLPPGYQGETPKEGYEILRATMNSYNLMVRGIVKNLDSDVPNGVVRVKQMKLYPWSERDKPKPNKFVSISGKEYNTLPPTNIEFWTRLSTVINNNPVQEHDRFFMAMLKPLGIEKGKPFQPDARQKAILEEAIKLGDAMARNIMFGGGKRIGGATCFAGTKWDWLFLVKPNQESEHYSQLDERILYTYAAIYLSPGLGVMKAGPGGNYVVAMTDKEGNTFNGEKSYRLNVPANVPASAFWSLTLYSNDSRSMIQNTNNNSATSSYANHKVNKDGSIDIYFGPKAPAGFESNWIQTKSGEGFFPIFRFYSPKAGLFDGTWKLPDTELMK